MKKKIKVQHIYIIFFTINILMLIAGIFWVKPNRFNLGESIEYTEITPVNYEKTADVLMYENKKQLKAAGNK